MKNSNHYRGVREKTTLRGTLKPSFLRTPAAVMLLGAPKARMHACSLFFPGLHPFHLRVRACFGNLLIPVPLDPSRKQEDTKGLGFGCETPEAPQLPACLPSPPLLAMAGDLAKLTAAPPLPGIFPPTLSCSLRLLQKRRSQVLCLSFAVGLCVCVRERSERVRVPVRVRAGAKKSWSPRRNRVLPASRQIPTGAALSEVHPPCVPGSLSRLAPPPPPARRLPLSGKGLFPVLPHPPFAATWIPLPSSQGRAQVVSLARSPPPTILHLVSPSEIFFLSDPARSCDWSGA